MAVKNKRKANKSLKNIKLNKTAPIVAWVIIAAIIISSAVFAVNSNRETVSFFDTDKEVLNGIDVSEHNGRIDWDEIAENADFAFIRVGYRGYGNGKIVPDKQARRNLKNAKKAGVPVGVYFYSQAVSVEEARAEAEFAVDFIKHYRVTLPVMIDFEYPADSDGNHTGRMYYSNLTARENSKMVNEFFKVIERAGYSYGIYSSSSIMKNQLDMRSIDKNAVIWVADYNENVTYSGKYDIWQYSKTGDCPGVKSKYTDLNRWYIKK